MRKNVLVALAFLAVIALLASSLGVGATSANTRQRGMLPAPPEVPGGSMLTAEWGGGVVGGVQPSSVGTWQCDAYDARPCFVPLESVKMVSPTEGWAVGQGGVLHYSGGTWQAIPSPTSDQLYSLYMLSPNEGWAVGATILHYSDGNWEVVASPAYGALHSVYMVSASDGWASGMAGLDTTLHSGYMGGHPQPHRKEPGLRVHGIGE